MDVSLERMVIRRGRGLEGMARLTHQEYHACGNGEFGIEKERESRVGETKNLLQYSTFFF